MTSDKSLGQLMGETTRLWRSLLDRRLKPLGLSGARWLVLVHTARAWQPLTQSELAERLGIGRPSLVGLLDRMAADGWIERHPHETDRRCNLVELSTRAHEVMGSIESEAGRLYSELIEGIDEKDIETTRRVLDHLKARGETLETS